MMRPNNSMQRGRSDHLIHCNEQRNLLRIHPRLPVPRTRRSLVIESKEEQGGDAKRDERR